MQHLTRTNKSAVMGAFGTLRQRRLTASGRAAARSPNVWMPPCLVEGVGDEDVTTQISSTDGVDAVTAAEAFMPEDSTVAMLAWWSSSWFPRCVP
jgi:hypothetical protein